MSQRQQNFTRSYPQFHQNTFTDGRKCTVVLRTADRYQNDFPVSVFRLTISFYNVFSSSYRFTQIAVDPQVKVPGGKTYDVLFIGTGNYWKRQKAYKFNSAKPINLIGFLFGFISTTSLFTTILVSHRNLLYQMFGLLCGVDNKLIKFFLATKSCYSSISTKF